MENTKNDAHVLISLFLPKILKKELRKIENQKILPHMREFILHCNASVQEAIAFLEAMLIRIAQHIHTLAQQKNPQENSVIWHLSGLYNSVFGMKYFIQKH